MFYNIFGSFLVLQLWLYIQYFVLDNCLLGDNFLCIYSCQVSVADLVLYSRFWNCAAWSRVFILVEKLQLRLMMLLLNYFLKLRCFGKCFLISFKNCPPTFVFTRSLYGALNHITFLFLLFLSLCCSIKFKVTLKLLSYTHIHFHIRICNHVWMFVRVYVGKEVHLELSQIS